MGCFVVFVSNNFNIKFLLATNGSVVEVKLPNVMCSFILGPRGVVYCFQITVALILISGLSSLKYHIRSKSPILFEEGIPNSVCGYNLYICKGPAMLSDFFMEVLIISFGLLALKAPITTAADEKFCNISLYFRKK